MTSGDGKRKLMLLLHQINCPCGRRMKRRLSDRELAPEATGQNGDCFHAALS